MKQIGNTHLTYFEERLERELADIERRIALLETERMVLRRQIAKASAERGTLQTATRKNSLERMLTENTILKFLGKKDIPQSTKALFLEARSINFELNENTFRTYLHRMKNRGLIKNGARAGLWVLSERDISTE